MLGILSVAMLLPSGQEINVATLPRLPGTPGYHLVLKVSGHPDAKFKIAGGFNPGIVRDMVYNALKEKNLDVVKVDRYVVQVKTLSHLVQLTSPDLGGDHPPFVTLVRVEK